MIDWAMLAPDLTEEQVANACERARHYGIASVTLRPADVQLASQWLKGSGVTAAAVVSYPHGASTTAVKNFETRDLLQRGAKIIETPLNPGKLKSRNFQYVELEMMQIVTECKRSGATVTLDLEFPSLTLDLRVIACRIAKRTEVDRVRAVSLYGTGIPTMEDLAFIKSKLGDLAQLDAGAWVRTLDELEQCYAAGATSIQTTDPAPILNAWKAKLKALAENAAAASAPLPNPATPN